MSRSFALTLLSWKMKISSPFPLLNHLAVCRLQNLCLFLSPHSFGGWDGYIIGVVSVFTSFQTHCTVFRESAVVSPCKSSVEESIGSLDYDFVFKLPPQLLKGHLYIITFTSRNITEPWSHIGSSFPFISLVCGKRC